MADNSSNTKRIAKNTAVLYVRMLILMAVSLYTSRVILQALGVSDFGIYNVVGGVVAMFSIISGSISASISRYLTFELGRKNHERLSLIFSTSINILLILGLIIVVIAEAAGVWFLNVKMDIPEGRYVAANWVFQFSLATFVVNLIALPYNAAIIAHEKMTAFAYISIVDALGKLGISFLVLIDVGDRLIFYALLMFMLALTVRAIYTMYCSRNFKECKYHLVFDKPLLKEMFGFAGWNFIGASSAIMRDQGGNVIINLFYGTVVNAACGIANQVNHAVMGFVNNFMTAISPQITKSYASGNHAYMMSLIFKGAKLSFFLLLLLSLPIILNSGYILSIWLTTVPGYAPLFVKLILIFGLSESISNPLITAMLATGNIRNYQIVVGGLQMLNLPIYYVLLRNGFPPQFVYITAITVSQLCFAARLVFLRKMINLDVKGYLTKVYFNILFVGALAVSLPWFVGTMLPEGFGWFLGRCAITVTWTGSLIYCLGLTKADRRMVTSNLSSILKKFRS